MAAITVISLRVGGIGTMNIVLATVLERTRQIRIAGIAFGYCKTIVWLTSIAFSVSVAVAVVFGIYAARQAARINAIEALRYE